MSTLKAGCLIGVLSPLDVVVGRFCKCCEKKVVGWMRLCSLKNRKFWERAADIRLG